MPVLLAFTLGILIDKNVRVYIILKYIANIK